MNPFLEPTVATPQPAANWRRPSHRAKRRGSSPGVTGDTARHSRERPLPAGGDKRLLGRTLRALLLAFSLLLPGLAMAVDINTATAQQLQEIKGIGPKTASIIIEERDRGGNFESMADVSERVKGIGPKKAAALEAAGLKVGTAVAAAGKAAEPAARPARRGR